MTTTSTNTAFYKFITIVALAACAFFWYKSCHPSTPSPVITQNNIANDSVGKLKAIGDAAKMDAGFLREDSIRQAGVIKDQNAQLSQTQAKLDKATKQHVGFANGVIAAKANNDSSGYVLNCDSLAYVTNRDQYIKDSLRLKIAGALGALNRANAIANEAKQDLHKQAVAYSGALSLSQKTNANLAAAAIPHTKLYAGIEAWTCPAASGVGGGVMYQDLKEHIYSLSAGVATTGGIWIGEKFILKFNYIDNGKDDSYRF